MRTVLANSSAQTLPFSQNWSNIGLITTNDDWAGVPGIEGFFLNNAAVSTTGVDPQTILGDTFGAGTTTVDLDVIANQTNPNTLANGGVAEFHTTLQAGGDSTNPTIALNGSGTADAPFAIFHLNTTGQSGITVSYNLRDLDCSIDNSTQPVALQFRVGNTGNYTNLPAGFVADASARVNGVATDTANCTLVTPVSTALPAAADNQPLVQVRVISTNAVGNDEWIGIDDISVTTGVVGDVAPSVASTVPTDNATGVALTSNLSVTFSEAVNAPSGAFTISCATSSTHTFVLSTGDNITFTLNPDSDFTSNEVCTVTVTAAQVTDQDTDDPPDNMAADFVFDFTTVNVGACGAAFTSIPTIQGSGTASPLVGNNLSTEGVVVGDFQGANNLKGFYIQDPTGDANTASSDGIFVFDGNTPAVPVAIGDLVRVNGTISESFNNTQINPAIAILVCSTGNPLPAATVYDLPEPVNNDLERVENMLVTFPETLTVSGNFTLGRFGELFLSSDGRMFQQNNFDRPNSPAALAVADGNQRRYIVLDDGLSIQNPDPTPYFDAVPTRRLGDTVAELTGILTFDFSEYRLEPTVAPVFTSANPRTSPPVLGGNVKASSFNVLNYFNGDGLGGGFPTSRGATSAAEFTRQRNKIIAAMVAINADVFGVIEIENDGNAATSAIQDLVNGLNAATAPGTFAFAEGVTPGTDLIKNSIIYKPATLTPVGSAVNDADAIWTGQARNPLAQTFSVNGNGGQFIFIVNHFTSKACSGSDTGGDADQGDGQGCDNLQRTLQAQRLLQFINLQQTATNEEKVLVMGDLNSYGEEDPIVVLEDDLGDVLGDGAGGLVDQIQKLVPIGDRYSFQFSQTSGYLDHALATKQLDSRVLNAVIWHNDADEPLILDYNVEFKSVAQQAINQGTPYRASDHDPVVVGLSILSPTSTDGTITGRITDTRGVPVAGAVVKLSGLQDRKLITDANGEYQFANVETNGFYTVRPSRANYSFNPAERSFNQLSNNTQAAFTGTPTGESANPLDTPEYFVRQHYLDFLRRNPDESGFNFWSNQILECGPDAGCIERRRINVSAAYFLSIEFQKTGGLVDGLYRASYGRRPAYGEFMPDTESVARDVVVGRVGWEQLLAANKEAFVSAFVQRPQFRAIYDGLSNSSYVDALISNTGVSFVQGERDTLVDGLNRGTLSRAIVLQRVAEDESFARAKFNEAFVMMEYFAYLQRDLDEEGFQFWLSKLNQFNGNFEQAEMVKAFIISAEYRDRFR